MAAINSRPFGITHTGRSVTEYVLSNPGGISVTVLDYGCILKNMVIPAKNGPVDVVLGHDSLPEYEKDAAPHFGAFVGRYANRIEKASFALNGHTYQLPVNDGPNHLHGTFEQKVFHVKVFGDSLLMETESPDGEEGFPGNLKVSVRYTLMPDNSFRMDYRASSDADTYVNLTNHSYFNLDGSGDVLNQKLRLYASKYLESRPDTCPTGRILPVEGTPMDFRAGKKIGQDIHADFATLHQSGDGYDHCYVIDRDGGASQSICAWASSDRTGISLKVYTTQPGVQLYTGNHLDGLAVPGKGGQPHVKYGGFALETQHFPCSPSHPEFPTTLLHGGKVFRATTTLRFFTGRQCGQL
jgi:aldose 1-epimerase